MIGARRRILGTMTRCKRKILVIVFCWVAAFAVGLMLDRAIAQRVARNYMERGGHPTALMKVMKSPGHFAFTSGVILLLIVFHRERWRAAGLILLSAAIGGAAYSIIKWCVGRRRPVPKVGIHPFELHPFWKGFPGLLHPENLSFPSGHAYLAFATAHSLGMFLPRWRILFYLGAAMVGLERIMENAHYLSDVIAGAALGILSVHLALLLARRFDDRNAATPATFQNA